MYEYFMLEFLQCSEAELSESTLPNLLSGVCRNSMFSRIIAHNYGSSNPSQKMKFWIAVTVSVIFSNHENRKYLVTTQQTNEK